MNVCCIFNYPSHYRFNIYDKMGRELKCDFYFGTKVIGNIKKFEVNSLVGFRNNLNTNYLFYTRLYFLKKSLRIFSKYKIFILEGELYNITTWIYLILALFTNKKIYVWSHGYYGRENGFKSFIKKIFFTLADGVFLYGNNSKKIMIQNGFSDNKLHVIYNSLDYDSQLKIRNCLNKNKVFDDYFNNNHQTLIFTGRLIESKNISLLIYALYQLHCEMNYFNLVIVGDGPDSANLKRIVSELNLDQYIWFYGSCYDENILSDLIFNATICVSPGEVGLTAIHSLVYGTPVITHSNFIFQGPEYESIIEGSTGSFFEFNNINSLKESIMRLSFLIQKDENRIRNNCFSMIDTYYNPYCQIAILKNIIRK